MKKGEGGCLDVCFGVVRKTLVFFSFVIPMTMIQCPYVANSLSYRRSRIHW
jgi:hypothetical protein